MTKRKRDIFTVIESINNWFEANKHDTNTSEDPEGNANHLVASSASSDPVTVNGLNAKISRSADTLELCAEALHVSSHPSCTSTGPGPQSEVADCLIPASEASYPSAVGAGYVPATEGSPRDSSHEGAQPTGYSPGTGETTGPGPRAEEERELVIAAFWRLLADAGYDVW